MSEIIYLDKEFIISEYEKKHKKSPIKYTKTSIVSAGMNIGANLGGSLRESFEYDSRVDDMWNKCKKDINKIKKCNEIKDLEKQLCPDIFWINGIFGLTEGEYKTKDFVSRYKTFVFGQEGNDCKYQYDILVDNSYFTSSYSQIMNSDKLAIHGFKIKAKMLLKKLGTTHKGEYIFAPLVIEKVGYLSGKK